MPHTYDTIPFPKLRDIEDRVEDSFKDQDYTTAIVLMSQILEIGLRQYLRADASLSKRYWGADKFSSLIDYCELSSMHPTLIEYLREFNDFRNDMVHDLFSLIDETDESLLSHDSNPLSLMTGVGLSLRKTDYRRFNKRAEKTYKLAKKFFDWDKSYKIESG